MAYHILPIHRVKPAQYPFYFFDCNVWIAQLQGGVNALSAGRLQPYVDFFEDIIEIHTTEKSKAANKPKIIVTSLLLSEIFNGYMRQIAMRVYYTNEAIRYGNTSEQDIKNYVKHYEFKRDYRKTNDYQDKLRKLKSDFIAFSDYIEFQDDSFKELDPISVVRSISEGSDFNDFYYYYSLVDRDVPIVTDDGDFIFQDISIITDNPKLLRIGR